MADVDHMFPTTHTVMSSGPWAAFASPYNRQTPDTMPPHQAPLPDENIYHYGAEVDWEKLITFLAEQLSTKEARRADTIVVTADNRQGHEAQHWEHVSRVLHDRTMWKKKEQWYFIWVPLDHTTGLETVHHTWAIVMILLVLVTAPTLATKHIMAIGHDLFMGSLWEIDELVEDAIIDYKLTMGLKKEAKPKIGIIVSSEDNTDANAGMVIIPRQAKPGRQGSGTDSPKKVVELKTEWFDNIKKAIQDYSKREVSMEQFWER